MNKEVLAISLGAIIKIGAMQSNRAEEGWLPANTVFVPGASLTGV